MLDFRDCVDPEPAAGQDLELGADQVEWGPSEWNCLALGAMAALEETEAVVAPVVLCAVRQVTAAVAAVAAEQEVEVAGRAGDLVLDLEGSEGFVALAGVQAE